MNRFCMWRGSQSRTGYVAIFTYDPTSGARRSQNGTRCGRASRFPCLVALSALLWLLTAAAWYRKVVEADPVTLDHYERTVAFVKIGDTVISEELIRQGLARVFTRYCDRPICQEWQLLEAEAREKKWGLWSMPNGVPPSDFRRSRR